MLVFLLQTVFLLLGSSVKTVPHCVLKPTAVTHRNRCLSGKVADESTNRSRCNVTCRNEPRNFSAPLVALKTAACSRRQMVRPNCDLGCVARFWGVSVCVRSRESLSVALRMISGKKYFSRSRWQLLFVWIFSGSAGMLEGAPLQEKLCPTSVDCFVDLPTWRPARRMFAALLTHVGDSFWVTNSRLVGVIRTLAPLPQWLLGLRTTDSRQGDFEELMMTCVVVWCTVFKSALHAFFVCP